MKCLVLVTFFVAVFATEKPVRYDHFSVYRLQPKNDQQLTSLKDLERTNLNYSFWTSPIDTNTPIDILVDPEHRQKFEGDLSTLDLKSEIFIENVQSLIDAETRQSLRRSGETYGWKKYGNLKEINDWLKSLETKYPGVVTLVKGGTSYQKRDILGIKIAYAEGLRRVFIEGGIHAREWISPATVTYIANQLLTSKDPAVRKLAESREWHIFPVFNPDGYVYTRINRLWRKTRKPYGFCFGADANRNWGYKWNHGGGSNEPCNDMYAGPKAFSEIESKSLSQYISTLGETLDAYLAIHSYSQLLLIPFGHDGLEVPANNEELLQVGNKAVKVLAQRYGTNYTVGNVPKVIYVASGGSMDWALAINRNMTAAYTYELRDKGRYGFLLPPEQIIPTGEETFDSVVSLFQQFEQREKDSNRHYGK